MSGCGELHDHRAHHEHEAGLVEAEVGLHHQGHEHRHGEGVPTYYPDSTIQTESYFTQHDHEHGHAIGSKGGNCPCPDHGSAADNYQEHDHGAAHKIELSDHPCCADPGHHDGHHHGTHQAHELDLDKQETRSKAHTIERHEHPVGCDCPGHGRPEKAANDQALEAAGKADAPERTTTLAAISGHEAEANYARVAETLRQIEPQEKPEKTIVAQPAVATKGTEDEPEAEFSGGPEGQGPKKREEAQAVAASAAQAGASQERAIVTAASESIEDSNQLETETAPSREWEGMPAATTETETVAIEQEPPLHSDELVMSLRDIPESQEDILADSVAELSEPPMQTAQEPAADQMGSDASSSEISGILEVPQMLVKEERAVEAVLSTAVTEELPVLDQVEQPVAADKDKDKDILLDEIARSCKAVVGPEAGIPAGLAPELTKFAAQFDNLPIDRNRPSFEAAQTLMLDVLKLLGFERPAQTLHYYRTRYGEDFLYEILGRLRELLGSDEGFESLTASTKIAVAVADDYHTVIGRLVLLLLGGKPGSMMFGVKTEPSNFGIRLMSCLSSDMIERHNI